MLSLFSTTLFVSAALLFWIQPLFAKMVLPFLGGAPAVWNTCMVFYQATLLAGYGYAHLTAKYLAPRRQAGLHMALLVLAFLMLPVGLNINRMPGAGGNPVAWVLSQLALSVGFPFFVISSTAPMLQSWFNHTDHPSAQNPYFLYAASNLGSIGALLGYPLLFEPNLTIGGQSLAWAAGFALMAALIACCAFSLRRPAQAEDPGPRQKTALTTSERLRWVLLSFAPSSLLLGLTTYITTDIAAVPLLWTVPLFFYLLTFVLVFARRPPVSHSLMVKAQPFVVLLISALFFLQAEMRTGVAVLLLHGAAFFVTSMVCHGELARGRPEAGHLTEFYLWVSLGGMLGGALNVLSPFLFDSVVEYPLALSLACMLRPGGGAGLMDFVLPLGFFIALSAVSTALKAQGAAAIFIASALAAVLCFSFVRRSVRFGLGVGAMMLAGTFLSGADSTLYSERSFFGVMRVVQKGEYRVLYHGTTVHGAQRVSDTEPLTYYSRNGPLGDISRFFENGKDIAVIGLGTGSMAGYARPGQRWTFYEIDPSVERIARDPRYFTFLRDSPAETEVILGDARIAISRSSGAYDLIVLDAFSSDSIPVHLVTEEALRLYTSRLKEGGIIAFHISNRYLDLRPVLGNLSGSGGLASLVKSVDMQGRRKYEYDSIWAVMAKSPSDLKGLADRGWSPLPEGKGRPWTDDFSNIVSVFNFSGQFRIPPFLTGKDRGT